MTPTRCIHLATITLAAITFSIGIAEPAPTARIAPPRSAPLAAASTSAWALAFRIRVSAAV